MADSVAEDLGLYADIPITAWVSKRLLTAYGYVFSSWRRYVLGFGLLGALAVLASAPLRKEFSGWLISVTLVVALVLIGGAYVAIVTMRSDLLLFLFYGPKLFGPKLDGPRASVVRSAILASDELEIEYSAQDRPAIDLLHELNREGLELSTRNLWLKTREPQSQDVPDPQLEHDWRDVWNAILNIRIGKGHFQDFVSEKSATTIAAELIGLNAIFDPLYRVSLVIVVWLGYEALLNPVTLLVLLQVSLLLSFVLSTAAYLLYSFDLAEQHILWFGPLPEQLKARFETIRGKVLRPDRMAHTNRYIAILRTALARNIIVGTGFIALTGIVMCLVSLAIGLVFTHESRNSMILLYARLGAVIALAPLGLVVGHYIMFFLVQNLRTFGVVAFCTAVPALIPPVAAYLWTGHLPDTATTTVTSAASATGGAVMGTLTSRLKAVTSDNPAARPKQTRRKKAALKGPKP